MYMIDILNQALKNDKGEGKGGNSNTALRACGSGRVIFGFGDEVQRELVFGDGRVSGVQLAVLSGRSVECFERGPRR